MESKPRLGYDSKSLAKVLRSWIYTPLSLAISAFDLRRHETQLTPGGSTEPFRRKLLLLAPDQQLPARMRSGLHALHPWFSGADGNPGDRAQSSRHPGPQGEQTASRAGSAHSCGLQNQLESLLEEAHIKLSSLVSDLLGLSAQRMLKAIAEGETNPATLPDWLDRADNGCIDTWEGIPRDTRSQLPPEDEHRSRYGERRIVRGPSRRSGRWPWSFSLSGNLPREKCLRSARKNFPTACQTCTAQKWRVRRRRSEESMKYPGALVLAPCLPSLKQVRTFLGGGE